MYIITCIIILHALKGGKSDLHLLEIDVKYILVTAKLNLLFHNQKTYTKSRK